MAKMAEPKGGSAITESQLKIDFIHNLGIKTNKVTIGHC